MIYYLAFVLAWLTSQLIKFANFMAKHPHAKVIDYIRDFNTSGGMPSSHTASLTALTSMFAFNLGWDNPATIIAICITLVIAYDATHVRRTAGEAGLALGSRLKVKPALGHTLSEVIAGAILGLAIAIALYLLQPEAVQSL